MPAMIVQKCLGGIGMGLEYMYGIDIGADDLFCQFGLARNLPPRRDNAGATRASSKTHMPWCLYGEITLIAFMRSAVRSLLI